MFSVVCFAVSLCRVSAQPEQRIGATNPLPWELLLASQHQACTALDCVCDHLCLISVFCIHWQDCPKVTLYTISAYESFHRNILLSDNRGNMYFP